jgi:hypothetical protein
MGKNRAIKILGNVFGNIVLHKILVKHTNKLESLHHLKSEVEAYRDNALEQSGEFNWNASDIEEIKLEALTSFKSDIKKYYPDVKFTIEEAENLVEETIEEAIKLEE